MEDDDIQIIKNFPVPVFLECCALVTINGSKHVVMLLKDQNVGPYEAFKWFKNNLAPNVSGKYIPQVIIRSEIPYHE